MLSARNALVLFVLAALLSIGATVYNLSKPPDSGGLAKNTYGTRAHGHRGIYEILEKLRVPVRRSLTPPPMGLGSNDRLLLIAPDQNLVEYESEHLARTAEWIENGGHAVVVLASYADDTWEKLSDNEIWDTTVIEELGFPALALTEISLEAETTTSADLVADRERAQREKVVGVEVTKERSTRLTSATLINDLTYLAADVRQLRLPAKKLQVIETTTATTEVSALTVTSEDDVNYTLVAMFPQGRGQVTVVTDSALFNNYLVDKSDNAVLTVNLLGGGGRSLVFDEFYHGLMARGNPLWLLTLPHYGWLFVIVAFGVAAWIWRQAVALGPPLSPKPVSRRSLGEYLDAMATLFTRSRQKRFLLYELRRGVVWALRERLSLSPGQENVTDVAAALERHHPEKAGHLRSANQKIDGLLGQKQSVDDAQFLEVSREINRCL